VNKYVTRLLQSALDQEGPQSSAYKGIYNQYFKIPKEAIGEATNRRHFEAELSSDVPRGVERFYRRVCVVALLTACAAECVYCTRGYYDRFAQTSEQLMDIVRYLAADPYLREVLITGGDPLVSPKKLKQLLELVVEHAPNIQIARIGSRVPVQDPESLDLGLLEYIDQLRGRLRVELALHVNHPFELQRESRAAIKALRKAGVHVYSTNVLLRDVNDNRATLLELYDELRYLDVTPLYLFHALPIKGTDSFRTSVRKGLDLVGELSASGVVSGRAKPQFTIMTDVGKVVVYHDSLVGRDGRHLIVKTSYRAQERRQWNKDYVVPDSAFENPDGTLTVRYLDGQD
jgi:lysine 2,3-aminomutase